MMSLIFSLQGRFKFICSRDSIFDLATQSGTTGDPVFDLFFVVSACGLFTFGGLESRISRFKLP